MRRRGFLSFLGGAAAAGPVAAKGLADSVLMQAGFPSASIVAAAAPAATIAPPLNVMARARRWVMKAGIPRWKMNEIIARANHDRSLGLDADIACLRSVSPGWKAREQRRRNLERRIEQSLNNMSQQSERDAFFQKMKKRFDANFDWWD